MTERLYRSPTDRVIAGVAGGLAAWLNIDPSLVRIAWVLLAIFSGGIFVLVYIVMMIVVPLPPPGWAPSAGPAGAPGQPPPPGWARPAVGRRRRRASGVRSSRASRGRRRRRSGPGWRSPDPGNAGIVFGVILVGLGVWFLIDQYVHIDWRLRVAGHRDRHRGGPHRRARTCAEGRPVGSQCDAPRPAVAVPGRAPRWPDSSGPVDGRRRHGAVMVA